MDQLQETKLSERERTVLLLAADGLTDKEIAGNLGLSLKTVHTYWDRMRQKFDASTRTQVFAKFLRLEVASGTSAKRFDHLFATWEEGVWVANPHNGTLYANRRISEMFGYEEQEFLKLTVEDVFAAAGVPEVAEFVREERQTAAATEAPVRTQDGTGIWIQITVTPWLDERGIKKAVVLRVHNITLQKRVEHALRSCEQVLDGLMDVATDCICRFNGDLVCTYANASTLGTLDCGPEALNIVELGDHFAPTDEWLGALRRVLQTGERQSLRQAHPKVGAVDALLLPDPSADFLPLAIIAVIRKPSAC